MEKHFGDASDQSSLEAPDYLALVIEWDHTADALEREIERDSVRESVRDEDKTQPMVRAQAQPHPPIEPAPQPWFHRGRRIAIAAAIGAIALLGLGIRRLRMA